MSLLDSKPRVQWPLRSSNRVSGQRLQVTLTNQRCLDITATLLSQGRRLRQRSARKRAHRSIPGRGAVARDEILVIHISSYCAINHMTVLRFIIISVTNHRRTHLHTWQRKTNDLPACLPAKNCVFFVSVATLEADIVQVLKHFTTVAFRYSVSPLNFWTT